MTRVPLAAVAVLFACCGPGPERPVRVLAFYYGWYGAPQVSGAWRHWDAGGHDPASLKNGLPDLASADHPSAGPYDSVDPATLERHLSQASAAGIDALIASWWGEGTFEDAALGKLLDAAEARGGGTKVAAYFEEVPGDDAARGAASLSTLLLRHGTRSAYLRRDGKPVVFVYGRAIFPGIFCTFESCPSPRPSHIDWARILGEVRETTQAVVLGDAISVKLFDLAPQLVADGFDGLHVYNPHVDVDLGADMAEEYQTIVRLASARKLISAATVIPGYDDRWAGRSYSAVTPRDEGRLFDRLWSQAAAAGPDWILVTSFNEWHEGSEIEPSVEYGDLYVTANRRHADSWR